MNNQVLLLVSIFSSEKEKHGTLKKIFLPMKKKKENRIVLEGVVFCVGAAIMIFEMVGSRILAPYMGTSLFVWTGIIGVILGALSIGYYYGGLRADASPRKQSLSAILVFAAISILFSIFIKDMFLVFLNETITDMRLSAALASLVLFAPTSMLLGMVAPYAARLKMDEITHSGSIVGRLYALSTIGSIGGTFLAGFVLIPLMGSTKILFCIAGLLLLCAFALTPFPKRINILIGIHLFLLSAAGAYAWNDNLLFPGIIQYDTKYNHVRIYHYVDSRTGKPAQLMRINNESSSAMFLEDDELVFKYTAFYDLAEYFVPHFSSALMLGGAGYSYPKHFLQRYQNATIDVVEIDPDLTNIAKKHFRLKDNPRLTIIHEDGRTFLRKNKKKYDVFLGDAYKSFYSLPYHLTTKEAVEDIFKSLNKDCVAIINIISRIEGKGNDFLRAEYATFADVFPQVFLFPVQKENNGRDIQNIILVASKSIAPFSMKSENMSLQKMLSHHWKKPIEKSEVLLTDDFAPVEHYIQKML